MKKFLAILFLLAFTITFANAQTGVTKTLGSGVWYYEYAGTAVDTTTNVGTSWDKAVIIPQIPERVFYNIQLKLAKTGSGVGPVLLQGKVFPTDAYTTITTVGWNGGADTVINFLQQTTATSYRYFNVKLGKATAGGMKCTWLKYSFKK